MSEAVEIQNIGADTTEAQQDIAQLDMQMRITAATIARETRRGYESISLLLDIAGIVIPQTIQLFASAAFLAAETLTELAAAETITIALATKAILTFAMAGILFSRAVYLQGEAHKSQQTINSLIQLRALYF